MDVMAIDEFVNAHGLLADAVQESCRVTGEDLRDVGVTQHGVESSDDGGQFIRRTAAASALDGLDSVADAVDAVADGMRKIAIEQEKFKNAIGREIGCVYLAVSFKRSTTTQKSDKFQVLVAGVVAFLFLKQLGLKDLEQGRGGVGPFKVSAQANELPALPVDHVSIAHAFE